MTPSRHFERRRFSLTLSLAALAFTSSVAAQSPAWPAKPLRVVLTSTPGAPSDIVMRIAGEKLQAALKQTVVIDNKAGAGGNLAAADVARALPDGTTWLWTTDNTLTVNPNVYKSLGFKPEDLTPVTIGSVFSQTLVCNPSLGVKTLAEFVKKAKATPLAYASGGAGVPGHLAMELLASQAGIEMEHIPYKGPAPAAQDVLGGQVPCGFLAGPTVLPHVRSGKLVALAVSGTQRSPVLPEVPTVAEAAFAGYDASFLLVMMAPKGTPAPIVAAMNKAMVEALKSPDVIDRLKATDQTVVADSPAQAATRLAALSRQWAAVVKRIQLSLD